MAACLITFGTVSNAQVPGGVGAFRVFLRNGLPIPASGDFVTIKNRIVFVLPIGEPATGIESHLVGVPTSAIDLPRTTRYAEAVRARIYAETRGPLEYSSIAAEVSLALEEIKEEKDPIRRVTRAEEARGALAAWPKAHQWYRIDDVRTMIATFDRMLVELRSGAGLPSMISRPPVPEPPIFEAPLPPPTLAESLRAALAVAAADDDPSERVIILEMAAVAAERTGVAPELRDEVRRRLGQEIAVKR